MRAYEARRLSEKNRISILERDNNSCQYCGDHADSVDHIVPWSHSHCDMPFNLVAACSLCNSIASNSVFETFVEKKNFVVTRRLQMLSRQAIPVWLESEVEELSGHIKAMVLRDCIIVSDYKEFDIIQKRLAASGFRISCGDGDRVSPAKLSAGFKGNQKIGKEYRYRFNCNYCDREFGARSHHQKYCTSPCIALAAKRRKEKRDAESARA